MQSCNRRSRRRLCEEEVAEAADLDPQVAAKIREPKSSGRGRLRPASTLVNFWMLKFFDSDRETKKKNKKTKIGKKTVLVEQSLLSV